MPRAPLQPPSPATGHRIALPAILPPAPLEALITGLWGTLIAKDAAAAAPLAVWPSSSMIVQAWMSRHLMTVCERDKALSIMQGVQLSPRYLSDEEALFSLSEAVGELIAVPEEVTSAALLSGAAILTRRCTRR